MAARQGDGCRGSIYVRRRRRDRLQRSKPGGYHRERREAVAGICDVQQDVVYPVGRYVLRCTFAAGGGLSRRAQPIL